MTETTETPNTEQHPDAETLARYTRGELPRNQGRELELHLMTCIECQSKVDKVPGAGVYWQAHRFGKRKTKQQEEQAARAEQFVDEQREHLRGVIRSLSDFLG